MGIVSLFLIATLVSLCSSDISGVYMKSIFVPVNHVENLILFPLQVPPTSSTSSLTFSKEDISSNVSISWDSVTDNNLSERLLGTIGLLSGSCFCDWLRR